MNINIRLGKNFVTQYNKLQGQFGTDIARINGFDDAQLSYTDFIDNFIDESTVADASIDEVEALRKKHEAMMEQLSEAEDRVRELNRMKVHESFAVTKLTAELLDEYVEGIEVHPGNEVRISWK